MPPINITPGTEDEVIVDGSIVVGLALATGTGQPITVPTASNRDNLGRTLHVKIVGNTVDDDASFVLLGRVNPNDNDGFVPFYDLISKAEINPETISTNTTDELGDATFAKVYTFGADYRQLRIDPTVAGSGTIDVYVYFGVQVGG